MVVKPPSIRYIAFHSGPVLELKKKVIEIIWNQIKSFYE